MYKQIIIARKDLDISAGKLAAQVSHASMAFISSKIRNNTSKICKNMFKTCDEKGEIILYRHPDLYELAKKAKEEGKYEFYAVPKDMNNPFGKLVESEPIYIFRSNFNIDGGIYENWFKDSFTKCILEAKNKSQLIKAKTMAEELGMKEGVDFFLIKDNCLTELNPEETDENGIGRTLTCIGFKPMDSEIIDKIGKKFQLYK